MKLRTIIEALTLSLELLTLNLILLTCNQLPTFPLLKELSRFNIKRNLEKKEDYYWQWQLNKNSCHVWYLYSLNQRGEWRSNTLSLCPFLNYLIEFAATCIHKFCQSKVPYYNFTPNFLPPVGHVLIDG